jgi:hypothetical protein
MSGVGIGRRPSRPSRAGSGRPGDAACDQIRLIEVVEVVAGAAGTDVDRAITSRNQYINMPPENNQPELGRVLRFRARVEWVSGSTRSLAGQTVYTRSDLASGDDRRLA